MSGWVGTVDGWLGWNDGWMDGWVDECVGGRVFNNTTQLNKITLLHLELNVQTVLRFQTYCWIS